MEEGPYRIRFSQDLSTFESFEAEVSFGWAAGNDPRYYYLKIALLGENDLHFLPIYLWPSNGEKKVPTKLSLWDAQFPGLEPSGTAVVKYVRVDDDPDDGLIRTETYLNGTLVNSKVREDYFYPPAKKIIFEIWGYNAGSDYNLGVLSFDRFKVTPR